MKIKAIKVILLLLFVSLNCNVNLEDKKELIEEKHIKIESPSVPLKLKDIHGRWKLSYKNDYGYFFKFKKNFNALIVIYASNHALIFKGIYTINEENMVRVNIYKMKRNNSVKNINFRSHFTKTKSSYFIFKIKRDKNKLIIQPCTVVIDGTSSQGYFENNIKLERQK
jgi:hypothetical protein